MTDADAQTHTDEAVQRVQAIIDEFDAEGCAEIRDDDAPALRTVLDALADTQERVAELEDLGTEAYADKLVEEMRLRSLEIRNGSFEMDITEAGELATAYVAMARTLLGDAENYSETPFEFHVKIAEEPQKYILTVQRTGMGKLTPHQARQRAEAERDAERARADTAEARVAELEARMRATAKAVEDRARTEDETGIATIYCAWWDASALVDQTLGLSNTDPAPDATTT